MEPPEVKARENRVRRKAQRRGYFLSKSRRRDELAADYGEWYLLRRRPRPGRQRSPRPGGMTLEQAEALLDRLGDGREG